ncbi:MAG: fluoride efflux transporter CrcB [Betaproteobacteria bacterium]|nr:fluoride efflux transporter CrcB [Betaproteobacteria bacterium]
MTFGGFLAVGAGAACGAWMRWLLGVLLNPVMPTLPIGTLVANWLGGYLIGLAVEFFGTRAGLPPEYRLFVVTGFLGALTTFSTFSAEAVNLLSRGQVLWAVTHIGSHLAGSLFMTVLGIYSMRAMHGG